MENKVFISFLHITSFYCNIMYWYSSQKVKQQQITAAPECYHYTYRQFHCINVIRIENVFFCATFLLRFSMYHKIIRENEILWLFYFSNQESDLRLIDDLIFRNGLQGSYPTACLKESFRCIAFLVVFQHTNSLSDSK